MKKQEIAQGRQRYAGLAKTTLCLALATVVPGNSIAFDIDYEAGVAAQHSDNIARRDQGEISDTVVAPRLWFSAVQTGSRVRLAAQGNVEYRHYIDDTFDDQLRGRFNGRLDWSVIPQRLDFIVQDSLSLLPVNQFAAFTPANEQQVNVFVAGPTLYARFTPVTRGQLDLRFIDSYAEETPEFDSQRYSSAVRVLHELSPRSNVSLNAEALDVDFDMPNRASDYRRYDGYASLTAERRRFDVQLDLGYSKLEMQRDMLGGPGFDESYPLGRITLDWRATPRSVFGITVRHQLSDAADYLINTRDLDFGLDRRAREFNDFRASDSIVEPNVFRERLVRGRYAYDGERLDLRVAPFSRRMQYVEGFVEDQERSGVIADLDFRLKPRTTLTVYGANSRREYQISRRMDEDWTAGVGVSHRFTRKWTGRVDLEHRTRESTELGRSYDENAVMVSLSYRR
ncbi:outer membrane beta-barrel protein [Lysobacter korlensis]|uniref:Outer membrane beta-barrel protein n=1 Tax=Lysobacter korlensis TaxID=553636 RepID=A0ABV6RQ81_9GAMM